jgi:hypothetical protein
VSSRLRLFFAAACILVALYAFGGILQAASLFTGAKALKNFSLWASLSYLSFTAALLLLAWPWRRHLLPRPAVQLGFGVVSLCAGFLLLWPLLPQALAIDSCLDAGGSFNYLQSTCDQAQSWPRLSLLERSGLRIAVASSLALLGAVGVARALHRRSGGAS